MAFMAAVGTPWSILWRRLDSLVARVWRLIIVGIWDNKLQVANPLIIVSSSFPYLPNQDPESSTDSSSDAGMGKAALSTILRTIVRGYAS